MRTQKTDGEIGRRDFLRKSGLAASAATVGAVAPFSAFANPANAVGPAVPQEDRSRGAGTVAQPSLSRKFARWVAGLRYEELPADVADRARGLTLQALTSALLGSQLPEGKSAARLALEEESGVRTGATMMVNGTKVTKGGAAFANSEMTLAGGKWDTFRMLTHPGTSIVPSALVAAEAQGATGSEFITGLAAGYEVMERMAADWIPTVMARGFHAGPVFGIFGAAVAAGKIMRFSENQIMDTIGLCVNLAGGNLESGALREGAAARNAFLAVLLAKQGHPGGEAALEGDAGFYHAYAGNNRGELTYSFTGDRQTNLTNMTSGLGENWMMLETLYRIYSISGYNIAHIDVTASLCKEHGIGYEDVEHVEAVVNWLETQYPSPAFPARREDIGEATRGSARYYAAYGVVKRGFPLLPTSTDPPEVLELMKRVTIIPSHDMALFAPRITIFTKDGKSYTKQATGREFIWGFEEQARRIREVIPGLPIPAARFEEIIATCRNLERQQRADRLVQLTLAA